MRSIKLAVAVVAVSGLMGCDNSQPSVYRVAVDTLTAQNTPATCYRAGNAPTNITDKVTNIVDEKQWVVWKGIEENVYLEPGNINYSMAEARSVTIAGDAIVGAKNDDGQHIFTSERTLRISDTETHTTTATYTFDELGKTLKGTLVLRSACAGSGCNSSPTCDVTLTFSGRQIDGDRYFNYGSGSGG